MDSFTWMDNGCQQVQPPLQSLKAAAWQTNAMRNHQTSYHYGTPNTRAHQPPSYSEWQAGATSCRQIVAGVSNPNYWRTNGNFQSVNPHFTAGDGAQHGFSPNYPQNSSANIGVFQNVTMRPAHTPAANSFHSEQWPRSDTLPFTTQNLNHQTNSTQGRLMSSSSTQEYFSAPLQSYANVTTNSSSSQQAFSTAQSTLSHKAPVSYSGWYGSSSRPVTLSSQTREKIIAKIAEDLRNSVDTELDGRTAGYYGKQYVNHSQFRVSEPSHYAQPGGNNSFNSQSAPLCSAELSPKTPHRRARNKKKGVNADARESYESSVQIPSLLRGPSTGGAVHLSPGCVGNRAVAVVQPLLQESCLQDARQNTFSKDELSHRKSPELPKSVSPEKSRQTALDESETSYSPVSDEPCLNSAVPLTPNQPTEPETEPEPEPATDIQDRQQVSSAPQVPAADAPESGSRDEDTGVNPADSPENVVELSEIPTIPYTNHVMRGIIHELNLQNMDDVRKANHCFSALMLQNMFGDSSPEALRTSLRIFNKIILAAKNFCRKHVTGDTVILSGVKEDDWKSVERHRILKHDEVYTEAPYQPFWLIQDEKLDDIEKKFGLPWTLRRRCMLDSDVHAEMVNNISEEILREVSETVLAQTEQELADSSGGKSPSTDQTTSLEAVVGRESNDPFNDLEIQVLPPEEALLIHEQAAAGSQALPQREVSGPAEATHPPLTDLEQFELEPDPTEHMCCMERLKAIIEGPSTALSGCKCQNEKDPEICDDEGDMKSVELQGISPDCRSDPTEGEHPTKGGECCFTQTVIDVETVDSLENGEANCFPTVDMDDVLLGHENRAPEWVDAGAPMEFTEPIQPRVGETYALADEEYCDETDTLWSLESREPERNHTSSQDHVESLSRSVMPPSQDSLTERKRRLSNVVESRFSSMNYGTAKLALFGSSRHAPTVSKMSQASSSEAKSRSTSGPPELLSVSLSPSKRTLSEAAPAEEPSIKLRIYEGWRKSLPPNQIRVKKFKSQKRLKKPDRTGGLLKQALSAEKRMYGVKIITKRGRLHPNGLKPRTGKNRTGLRRQAENQTTDNLPEQENITLKFSVLPESFNFKDETQGTKSTTTSDLSMSTRIHTL